MTQDPGPSRQDRPLTQDLPDPDRYGPCRECGSRDRPCGRVDGLCDYCRIVAREERLYGDG